MKDAAWRWPVLIRAEIERTSSPCMKQEFTPLPEQVEEECTAIKVPFLGWKQHSSAGSSGSARLRAAAPRGTQWHGWLPSMKGHVPGHRGLTHPSHVTSFRASECPLDLPCAVLCRVNVLSAVASKAGCSGLWDYSHVGLFSFIIEQISWLGNSCTTTKGHLSNWNSLYHLFLIQESGSLSYSRPFWVFFFSFPYDKAKMKIFLSGLNLEYGQVFDQNTQWALLSSSFPLSWDLTGEAHNSG